MTFAERLQQKRKEMKLSQLQLAEMCEISRRSMQYYENGRIAPDIETLQKISEALSCSTQELLGDDTEKSLSFREIAEDMALAFSGGRMSEADRDAIFEIIHDAYEKSKAMNESGKNDVQR